jgi:peptide/nickel transport system substrate-binding protein
MGLLALTGALLAAAACSAPVIDVPFDQGAEATATPAAPQPTPPPAPNVLVVCLSQMPDTFYLYDSPNASAQTLLPAIYDGPFDVLGYTYRPVIVEAVPSPETGSVRFETAPVGSGDVYFNPETMMAEIMAPGKPYLPSGCTSADCMRRFEGGQAELDRQVVEFRLIPDLLWSDGTPLTARDSVFSFQLDADPATPSLKDQVNRTALYEAVDDRTIRWTGIPGYADPEFPGDFWSPLPEHVLGSLDPAAIPQAEAAMSRPLGWGPYVVEEWTPGQSIAFSPNPNYRRHTEGLPAFDRLVARVIGDGTEAALQQVLTGECDVLEEGLLDDSAGAALDQLAQDGRLRSQSTPGTVLERLDFATAPSGDRPAVFGQTEMRRSIAACIDRQGLIDELVPGRSSVPSAMIAEDHPLAPETSSSITYSPGAAGEALTSLGWIDEDDDAATPRVARGADGVAAGSSLVVTLLTAPGAGEEALAQALADDLAQCGVGVEVEVVPPETLYAPWPDGPAFGRDFDLVVWPWLEWITPACELFTTAEIASLDQPEGANASGFSDSVYDEACREARLNSANAAISTEAFGRTLAILDEALPSLPLLQWPRLLVASSSVCGPQIDPTAPLLWNLEEFVRGPECVP